MFGNSKEYQDIKKLYEEKVSKPENINEITGGLGPIPNANSNNNVKVNTTNNNNAPKLEYFGSLTYRDIGEVRNFSRNFVANLGSGTLTLANGDVGKVSAPCADFGNAQKEPRGLRCPLARGWSL